jgi:hypothetical protein
MGASQRHEIISPRGETSSRGGAQSGSEDYFLSNHEAMDDPFSTPITSFQQLDTGIEVWSSMQHSARNDNCASVFESMQKLPAQAPLQGIAGTLLLDSWLVEEPDALSSASSLSLNDAANTGTAANTDAVSLLHFSQQAKLILLSSFRIRCDHQQWLPGKQRR